MKHVLKVNNLSRSTIYLGVAAIFLALWFSFLGETQQELRLKSFMLMSVYVFYIVSWIKCTHKIKSVFLFFLCYTALTNAGQIFLFALDIDIIYNFNVFDTISNTLLNKAMDFQVLCTVLMCTAAMIAYEFHSPAVQTEEKPFDSNLLKAQNPYSLTIPELIYLVSAAIFFTFNIAKLGTRVDNAYLDAFNSGDSVAVPLIVAMTFYVCMYHCCYVHRKKGDPFKKIIIIVNTLVGVSNVLYGSRNVLIPLLLGMIFLWNFDYKKLSTGKKVGVVLVSLLALYLLGSFVNLRRVALSDISFSFIMDALFGVGFFDQITMTISEMGGSLRVLTTTINSIDSGVIESEQTFLYTVLKGIVPQVELLDMVGIHEPSHWRLSEWITRTFGDNAGWGYSMYAESYFNFKWLGCIFMGAFGYIYVWLETKIEKWYMKGYTIMASGWLFFACYVIFLARADSLLLTSRFRYAVYMSILCALLRGRIKLGTPRKPKINL